MIPSTKNTQRWMNRFLLTGTLLAMMLVLIGGVWYLILHGGSPLQTELLTLRQPMGIWRTLQDCETATPLGLIEFGLGLLIATQVLRVLWLLIFYIKVHDRWYIFFTGFILCAILYSLFLMG